MQITTKAIVISSIKYSEADLIVKCFTEECGLKSYLLKNILKSKKGTLRASFFQPLSLLEITANHRNKGTLEFIREAKVYYTTQTLHTHIVKTSIVLFLSETLKSVIQEEEENQPLFSFIEQAIIWLETNDKVANFHLFFLLQLTDFLGFYPNSPQNNLPYFNLIEGVFQAESTNIYSINVTEKRGLKQLFGIKFDNIFALNFTKKERKETLQILILYYELHIQGFKKPKSLQILNQLFN